MVAGADCSIEALGGDLLAGMWAMNYTELGLFSCRCLVVVP